MRPLVVLASGVAWDGGVVGSERRLAEALTAHADVLWVDPPRSPLTRPLASWRPVLREVADGITRLTPVALPGWTRGPVRRTTWPLVRGQIRSALGRRRPAAVVACSFDDLLGRWQPGVVNVLYGTDDWVAGAELMGQRARVLRREERAALRRADLVLAVSPELADRWRAMGADPVVLPNGCDPDAYAVIDAANDSDGLVAPAELPVGFPGPVAGLVGQLSDRIDLRLLELVADTGIGLLLVGPHHRQWEPQRMAALLARPNVHHVGLRPASELPRWAAAFDVGITPYADTAFNRAAFPLKTLEYLAAGRAVVSTDLPAARRLNAECPDVVIAGSPAEFASAVAREAAAPWLRSAAERRMAVARRHSWAARAATVAGLLGIGRTETVGQVSR